MICWKVTVFCTLLLVCANSAKHIIEKSDSTHERDLYHTSKKLHRKPAKDAIAEEELHSEYWNQVAQETLFEKLNIQDSTNKAKNVIFFIGDGMSPQTVAATRMYLGNENEYLSFEKFPYFGQAMTYCVNRQVADSACTGTAYLSGVKINYAMLNVAASVPRYTCEYDESEKIYGIMKWAQDAGKSTGIVTNTRITDASPAAAYAHSASRGWEYDAEVVDRGCDPEKTIDIAQQLIRNEVPKNFKVAMGGGRRYFRPTGEIDEENDVGYRTDGKNLIDEWLEFHEEMGQSEYVWNKEQLVSLDTENTEYLLGLFEPSTMRYNLEVEQMNLQDSEPSLSEMVEAAIKIVRKNEEGFVLFVEGGLIDKAHHGTRPRLAVDETAEFAKAIALARSMTSEEDTLIVVSADHSHTMTYNGYTVRGNDIFGIADIADGDNLPYTTLSYANGPGYAITYNPANLAERLDISGYDFSAYTTRHLATAPVSSETHGGEDIGVWASGPQAHHFVGVYEQHMLPVMMAYIGGFDEFIDIPDPTDPTEGTTQEPTESTTSDTSTDTTSNVPVETTAELTQSTAPETTVEVTTTQEPTESTTQNSSPDTTSGTPEETTEAPTESTTEDDDDDSAHSLMISLPVLIITATIGLFRQP